MTIIAPPPIETTVQSPLGEIVPMTRHRFSPSPLNRRRWQNFKSNRRGYWSFWIFLILFFVSLFAELIANDRPFLIKFDGHSETDEPSRHVGGRNGCQRRRVRRRPSIANA